MKKEIFFPASLEDVVPLETGQQVVVSGSVYTARDAAHKKIVALLDAGLDLPFPLNGELIYYTGPTPAPPGRVIGSCGPTTSSRMDSLTLPLLKAGIRATMGKGARSAEIAAWCRQYKCVYLIAYGGCGALLSQYVKKSELVAYPELGAEAVFRLELEGFPAVIGIDTKGNTLYNL